MSYLSLFSRRVLPAALLASLSQFGHAAGADTPARPEKEMGGVVVSASRSQAKLEDMALNTTVITREDILKSPAQTLDQMLAFVPGFNLGETPAYSKDPTGQSIAVRGLGATRTLVLVDGTPLNDAFYGTVQWNRVPLSSIERVEIIRGGTSSQWGNLAMSGVVNIVTKAPQKDGGEARVSYGSFNTSDLSIAKDQVISDTVKLRLTADNFLTDGYQTVPKVYPTTPANAKTGQGDAYARNTNAGFQAYFSPAPDLNGYVRAGYHILKDLSSNYSFAVNSLTSTEVSGGVTKMLAKDEQIQAYAYFQDTQFDKINGSTSGTTPYANATYNDPYQSGGGSVLWLKSLHGPISQVTAGVDYRRISGSNTTRNLGTTGTVSGTNYGKGTQDFYGLLAEVKINPTGLPLEITAGARYDYWLSSDSDVYSTTGATRVVTTVPDQRKRSLDPSITVRLDATENTTLRAAGYRAFRAPGMNNMYRSYGKAGQWAFANPNLMPETMTGGEVGADYRWASGIAKFTVFDNTIKNAVVSYNLVNGPDTALAQQLCGADATKNPFTNAGAGSIGVCAISGTNTISYYTNNQNLRSQGLEADAKFDLTPAWTVDMGYALTYSRLTWSKTSDPVGYQVGGVPKNVGTLGVTWKADDKLTVQLQTRLVSRSWLDTAHLYFVPGYAVANAKVSYRIDKNLEAFGSVINLFDRHYMTMGSGSSYTSSSMGMPRAVFLGGRMTF